MIGGTPGHGGREEGRGGAWESRAADPDPLVEDLGALVGRNLRRARTALGLSLDRLARASGVSRAMLGQIELGRSVPTITLLWKVARALNMPFATLLGTGVAGGTVVTRASDAAPGVPSGVITARALCPVTPERKVVFHEVRLAAGGVEDVTACPPGTHENLVVQSGHIEIRVGGERHSLGPGDAILFDADGPHGYRNCGEGEAVMYRVTTYQVGFG